MINRLKDRSGSKCELCGATDNLSVYEVQPADGGGYDKSILICETCKEQIEDKDKMEPNHWRCLNDSMWSEFPAVQVMAWRMLTRLKGEGWSDDLLEMLYLDDENLAWAKATGEGDDSPKHTDSNGNILQSGDNVVLIKTLDVKGSSLSAKKGTVVKRISLVLDNHEQIEGKVEGQQIVLLTKFVRKTK
jgi:protein PhnA